jgi:hypothetical protein
MGNFLYAVAVILIIFWAIGLFFFSLGAIIHILLVLAIISLVARIFSGNKRVK